METWSFPNASPISCNDCPTFQRPHMSALCIAESLTRLDCVINTTFREKIYSRWCCIDRLSWHALSGFGNRAHLYSVDYGELGDTSHLHIGVLSLNFLLLR